MSTDTQNSAPVSAEPTDDEIIDMAVEPLGIDCDRMPYGVIVFARTLLSRYSAAPVAAQTDVTQQTLDDVKAGIPARDAEITALRKEIEALRDANKADAGQSYNDGFSDGVILALQLMTMHGDYGGTQYCELLSAAGPNQIVERAINEGMWEMSGLSQTPTAVERRAVIDAARKEPDQ